MFSQAPAILFPGRVQLERECTPPRMHPLKYAPPTRSIHPQRKYAPPARSMHTPPTGGTHRTAMHPCWI